MRETTAATPQASGPICYENWKKAIAGERSLGGGEAPAFTDARITGDLSSGFGPYQVLNTIASPGSGFPALVFRYWWHTAHELPDMSETDVERYHGGGIADEIAALVSLAMGIRLQAGGENRTFGPREEDGLGRPRYLFGNRDPQVPHVGIAPILPRCSGTHNLNEGCEILSSFPKLSASAANALIRAARMYQEGLWVSETSPSLSWLLLVSAVETAASYWRTADEPPMDRLSSSRPKLIELLREKGDDTWVAMIASELAPYMGATKKFTDFLLHFLPSPPTGRAQLAMHPWEPKLLKASLAIIYRWRSRALHGGTPFPLPMCQHPSGTEGGYTERPLGLATAAHGGIWTVEDTPMLLHVFEHIARGALLKWWGSLVAKPDDGASA